MWMSERFARKNCEDTFDEGAKLSKPSYDPCGTSVSLSPSSQNKSNVMKVFQSSYRKIPPEHLVCPLYGQHKNTQQFYHSVTPKIKSYLLVNPTWPSLVCTVVIYEQIYLDRKNMQTPWRKTCTIKVPISLLLCDSITNNHLTMMPPL